jgi:hypothetical protein
MRPTGKKKTQRKLSIAQRRELVTELYLKGRSQREIAQVCKVDQKTICKDIKAILEESKERRSSMIDTAILELKLACKELWEQWDRSKEDFKIRYCEITDPGKDGEQKKRSLKKEQRLAEVAFQKEIRENLKLQCELAGVKPPTKFAPTNPDGTQPYDPGISGRSFAALLTEAKAILQEEESSSD